MPFKKTNRRRKSKQPTPKLKKNIKSRSKKKKIRKHSGINQATGKLKKGYKYSGKKLKNGLPQIVRTKQSKSVKKISCKKFLSIKIKKNMKELKKGRYKNRKQALAVSFSQTKKEKPGCKKVFKK